MNPLMQVAVGAHIAMMVGLAVWVGYAYGPLPALVLGAVTTLVWVLWARHVEATGRPVPPAGPAMSPRFRAPEDDDRDAEVGG